MKQVGRVKEMTRAKSISIITLGVADLERSIKFYE